MSASFHPQILSFSLPLSAKYLNVCHAYKLLPSKLRQSNHPLSEYSPIFINIRDARLLKPASNTSGSASAQTTRFAFVHFPMMSRLAPHPSRRKQDLRSHLSDSLSSIRRSALVSHSPRSVRNNNCGRSDHYSSYYSLNNKLTPSFATTSLRDSLRNPHPQIQTQDDTSDLHLVDWLEQNRVANEMEELLSRFLSATKELAPQLGNAESLASRSAHEVVLRELQRSSHLMSSVITTKAIITSNNQTERNGSPSSSEQNYVVVVDPLEGDSDLPSGELGSIFSLWEGSPLGRSRSGGSSTEERSKRHVRGRKSLLATAIVIHSRQPTLYLGVKDIPGAHVFRYKESSFADRQKLEDRKKNCHSSGAGEILQADDDGVLEGLSGWSHIDSVLETRRLKTHGSEATESKVCAGGNWRALGDRKEFQELLNVWMSNSYQIVATGSILGDATNVLLRGGLYGHVSSESSPPYLRLLHHAMPLSLLFSLSGGTASNGVSHILDCKVHSMDDTTQAAFGSTADVQDFTQIIGAPKATMSRRTESSESGEGQYELVMANPRGFCEGVNRAVDTVEEALRIWGAPVYVKHEIVHNELVCNKLRAKGAVFVEDLGDVPEKSVIIYSSHGIPPEVREQAKARQLLEVDATCPLVTKVHVYVKKRAEAGYRIILVGHKNHVEIIGTAGEAPESTTIVECVEDVNNLPFSPDEKLFYTTQTTLSMDDCDAIVAALKQKYPNIDSIPSGSICYATTNRQTALKQLAPDCDVSLVVGSQLSSNAKRLVETARNRGIKSYLVNDAEDINPEWFSNTTRIALTSSASTPEDAVQRVVKRLKELGVGTVREHVGVEERLPNWRLPRNLEVAAKKFDGSATRKTTS